MSHNSNYKPTVMAVAFQCQEQNLARVKQKITTLDNCNICNITYEHLPGGYVLIKIHGDAEFHKNIMEDINKLTSYLNNLPKWHEIKLDNLHINTAVREKPKTVFKDRFAGSGFENSPSPNSLPLPSWIQKKCNYV